MKQTKNKKKAPCDAGGQGEVGGALLSRAPGRSIIAARALNGRVRDGNGCLCPAMATNQVVQETGGAMKPAGMQTRGPRPRLRPRAGWTHARGRGGQAARPIRTPRLSASPRLRLGPVNPVVSRGPSEARAWDRGSPGGLGA